MSFIFQIVLVVILILLNGYFVASEFSLVSIRKTRVSELAKKGNMRARMIQGAIDQLDTFISATQLGVTLASLALGWIGEPVIARVTEPFFSFLPPHIAFITSHTVAITIAFLLITFFHIVIGELVPKRIALQLPESTSFFIITPLTIFVKIFTPFIWLLRVSGQQVTKLLHLSSSPSDQRLHSEDEIKTILQQSSQGGRIPTQEVEMVYNVFQLGDIPVKSIMIPRTDILAFKAGTKLSEVVEKIENHPHSRFPVYENSVDTIIGFVHVKDVYKELLKDKGKQRLSQLSIIRDIITVPEGKKVDALLQDMRKKRTHLAVVNDEFGGTAGIVTLEDALESLVGEIEDEFDKPTKDIEKQKDGSYLVRGQTLITEIQEKFHLPLKGQGYTTIGGLVFGLLGHEPHPGDEVQLLDLVLTVDKTEGKRIHTLQLKKKSKTK